MVFESIEVLIFQHFYGFHFFIGYKTVTLIAFFVASKPMA